MRRVALAALAMLSGCSAAPGALCRTHAVMSSLELKMPPPVVALFFALCMWLASSLVAPLELPFVLRVGAALTLVAVGFVVSTAGVVSFRRARTTINPTKPMTTSALVSGGFMALHATPCTLGYYWHCLAGPRSWQIHLLYFSCPPSCSTSTASKSNPKSARFRPCLAVSIVRTRRGFAGGCEA